MASTPLQLKVKIDHRLNVAVTEMARDLGVSRGTIVRDALAAHTRTPTTIEPQRFVEKRQGYCPANRPAKAAEAT